MKCRKLVLCRSTCGAGSKLSTIMLLISQQISLQMLLLHELNDEKNDFNENGLLRKLLRKRRKNGKLVWRQLPRPGSRKRGRNGLSNASAVGTDHMMG